MLSGTGQHTADDHGGYSGRLHAALSIGFMSQLRVAGIFSRISYFVLLLAWGHPIASFQGSPTPAYTPCADKGTFDAHSGARTSVLRVSLVMRLSWRCVKQSAARTLHQVVLRTRSLAAEKRTKSADPALCHLSTYAL